MKFQIQFIITGLSTGGAEMMLYKLLSRIDRSVFLPKVISLSSFNSLGKIFQEIDVPVEILGMHPGIPDPRGLFRLVRLLRQDRPHLVQTWMYHADLLGGLATIFAGNIPVVWNIRHSNLDAGVNKKTTIWTAKACALLSHSLPARIICCAEVARRTHEAIGYEPSKMTVIPNGFDITAFKTDPDAPLDVRRELDIPRDSPIIGLVARFHPQKDHKSFIEAAGLLNLQFPNARFVLCGKGTTWENRELAEWITTAGLSQSFFLLGPRTDIPRLTASFDVAVSSSCGEGFSNTLGEAMACEVPCVATDVGDSAMIVGDTGKVVPSRDPSALAEACKDLIILGDEGRRNLGRRGRQRVLQLFSLDRIVKQYETLYGNLLCRIGS